MGLSGRKTKQRIPQDPRNLSWADDAARFGSNYLSKFGWDASKGLGAEGEGRLSHIKVSHKLDMLGIGAANQRDPNGIAWKQNRDFENLLQRLNEAETQEAHLSVNLDSDRAEDVQEGEQEKEGKKKKKKRKYQDGEHGLDRKKKKRLEKDEDEREDMPPPTVVEVFQVHEIVQEKTASVEVKKTVAPLPRHRAHRARAIAAKNISSKSAAHISEILGIAPTPSTSSSGLNSGTETPEGRLTSLSDLNTLDLNKITTSTMSVADYFKDKMKARSSNVTPSGSTRPASDSDPYDKPRMGLGSSRANDPNDENGLQRMGIGSSRLRSEPHSEMRVGEEAQRVGLSKFSSLISSSFLATTSSFSVASCGKQTEEQDFEQTLPELEICLEKIKSKKKMDDVDIAPIPNKKERKPKKDKKGKGKEEVVNEEAEKKSRKDKKNKDKRAEPDPPEPAYQETKKESRKKEKLEETKRIDALEDDRKSKKRKKSV